MAEKIIPTQKTRLKWLLTLTVMATVAWVLSMAGYITGDNAVTFVMWSDFEKWLFFAYGSTEVGAKYSHAVLNRQ